MFWRRRLGAVGCVAVLAAGLGGPSGRPASAAEPACRQEDELAEAATLLLLRGTEPDPEAVLQALREARSDLPSAHALRLPGGGGQRLGRWLRRLRERADAPLVCGEAASEGVRLVLAAPRAGRLEDVPGGLRVHLARGFEAPRIVLRDGAGTYRRLGSESGARVPLPDSLIRPVRAQLVASGPAGPRPVAVRTIGEDRPDDPGEPEGRPGDGPLAERLAELRALHGAGALRPNRLLGEAASDHAARVCRSGRVAHALEPGADPEARLAHHHVRARVVGEVVARATDAAGAFDALLDSPSHRLTMIDDRFTDVGEGLAQRRGRACVVLLFAAWPRLVPR
ncbi:MAG: CAP domain-containing protein [Myxococcota bacterium]